MNTKKSKPKKKKIPAYIRKGLEKYHLDHARRSNENRKIRLKQSLEKGKFETFMDIAVFKMGLSSSQLAHLGSRYLNILVLIDNKTPSEILEMASPVKEKQKRGSMPIATATEAESPTTESESKVDPE